MDDLKEMTWYEVIQARPQMYVGVDDVANHLLKMIFIALDLVKGKVNIFLPDGEASSSVRIKIEPIPEEYTVRKLIQISTAVFIPGPSLAIVNALSNYFYWELSTGSGRWGQEFNNGKTVTAPKLLYLCESETSLLIAFNLNAEILGQNLKYNKEEFVSWFEETFPSIVLNMLY